MELALEQAESAIKNNEVPVGAVLVSDNKLIAAAHNTPISDNDPSAHAEIQLLRKAGQILNNYRFPETTLYVTLEPCVMCAGAIVHARVARVVIGTSDPRTGAAGSVFNLLDNKNLNHRCEIESGVLASECSKQLHSFFRRARNK